MALAAWSRDVAEVIIFGDGSIPATTHYRQLHQIQLNSTQLNRELRTQVSDTSKSVSLLSTMYEGKQNAWTNQENVCCEIY